MSRGKLTVRLAVIAFGLLILAGAFLVARDGSTSRDGPSAGPGVSSQATGPTGSPGEGPAGP
jgi:hypothetical protein